MTIKATAGVFFLILAVVFGCTHGLRPDEDVPAEEGTETVEPWR